MRLGQAIRKLKQQWQLGAMLAPVLAIKDAAPLGVAEEGAAAAAVDAAAAGAAQLADAAAAASKASSDNAGARHAEVTATLLAAAHAFELQDCWQWKPLLVGKDVMAAAGMTQQGPQLGKLISALVDWQLAHPKATAEEAKQFVAQLTAGNKASAAAPS